MMMWHIINMLGDLRTAEQGIFISSEVKFRQHGVSVLIKPWNPSQHNLILKIQTTFEMKNFSNFCDKEGVKFKSFDWGFVETKDF